MRKFSFIVNISEQSKIRNLKPNFRSILNLSPSKKAGLQIKTICQVVTLQYFSYSITKQRHEKKIASQ